MRVINNSVNEGIVRQLQQLNADQVKYQSQISTNQRVRLPEDDPAATGRILNLQTQQREVAQWTSNAARAQELAQSSYSTLSGLKNVSSRAGELATLGAGALGADAMVAYAKEADQLIEHTLQVANSRFGNNYIFAGTATDTAPFTAVRDSSGKITSIAYVGNTGSAPISLSEGTAVNPLTTGATNAGIADFLNQLVALRDALQTGDTTAVTATQSGLATSEDVIVDAIADNGGIQSRIAAAKSLHTDRATSLESLVSSEADADLSTALVKLKQTQTAYEAALQSGASIMKLSLLDYIK